MKTRIDIVWGEGKGTTATSAFDAALIKAGIANFNLVTLSSIIPPDCTICEAGVFEGKGTGKMLPVALTKATGRGYQVAGMGWVSSPQGGLLLESSGSDRTQIIHDIEHGLKEMMEKRDWDFSPISYRIAEADYPLGCALVAAVFVIPRPQFLEWFWTFPSAEGVHLAD